MAEELQATTINDPLFGGTGQTVDPSVLLTPPPGVFAAQAPKGLHNRIPGNAATQFFGFLNSIAQINAATELARAKGGHVDDISRLRAGQFYAASEGVAFEKVHEPMCLSFHPPSPPSAEEVIRQAAEGCRTEDQGLVRAGSWRHAARPASCPDDEPR